MQRDVRENAQETVILQSSLIITQYLIKTSSMDFFEMSDASVLAVFVLFFLIASQNSMNLLVDSFNVYFIK